RMVDRVSGMLERTEPRLNAPERFLAARFLGRVAERATWLKGSRARGMQAAGILRYAGTGGSGALRSLMRVAANPNHVFRAEALENLAAIGPGAAGAFPLVERISREDPDAMMRLRAVVAAYLIARPPERTRDLLIRSASDGDAYVRSAAIRGIERLDLHDA